jgi:hypothetical protein
MSDPVDDVLRLVAEGRLTAEEAAPILDALDAGDAAVAEADAVIRGHGDHGPNDPPGQVRPRFARIEVFDHGRAAVNLRIPLSLGRMAMTAIPGLAGPYANQINDAIANGAQGSVLDVVDEDGDGVRVVLE